MIPTEIPRYPRRPPRIARGGYKKYWQNHPRAKCPHCGKNTYCYLVEEMHRVCYSCQYGNPGWHDEESCPVCQAIKKAAEASANVVNERIEAIKKGGEEYADALEKGIAYMGDVKRGNAE